MRQAELDRMGVEREGLKVSVAMMGRHLKRLGWTRKKKQESSEPPRWTQARV